MSQERLFLFRETLEGIPRYPLPPGYTVRHYKPGDEAAWLAIHDAADPITELGPGLFAEKFGSDPSVLARRQFYILDSSGTPVGTVTAWQGMVSGHEIGRVHWLAVLPSHQGNGIGSALLTLACEKLREEGYQSTYLISHPARENALRLYLKFGFKIATSPW